MPVPIRTTPSNSTSPLSTGGDERRPFRCLQLQVTNLCDIFGLLRREDGDREADCTKQHQGGFSKKGPHPEHPMKKTMPAGLRRARHPDQVCRGRAAVGA
jgi:hypothetical protein